MAVAEPVVEGHAQPADKGHVAYFSYFLLGVGLLFPWNAFITAVDYFEAQYPGSHADRLFSVCYLPTNLVAIAVMIHYQTLVPTRTRILAGYGGFVVAMVAQPLLDAVSAGGVPLGVAMLFVGLTGVSDGLAQAALFGDCAILPGKYTQAVVSGTSVSGLLVSLLRIITKAALPATASGLRTSASVYFSVSACVCAACFACYARLLPRLPLVAHFRALAAGRRDQYHGQDGSTRSDDGSGQGPVLHVELAVHSSTAGTARAGDEVPLVSRRADYPMTPPAQSPASLSLSPASDPEDPHADLLRKPLPVTPARSPYWRVGQGIWQPAASVLVIYIITLAIFPGFLAEDVKSDAYGDWYPVLLIAAFNAADVVGKTLPAWDKAVLTKRAVILHASWLRVGFIPAFWGMARGGAGPAWIGLLTVLLGVSNGYLTALAMMVAPRGYQGMDAEVVGNIMVFFLVLGLSIGAACGFLWLL